MENAFAGAGQVRGLPLFAGKTSQIKSHPSADALQLGGGFLIY